MSSMEHVAWPNLQQIGVLEKLTPFLKNHFLVEEVITLLLTIHNLVMKEDTLYLFPLKFCSHR